MSRSNRSITIARRFLILIPMLALAAVLALVISRGAPRNDGRANVTATPKSTATARVDPSSAVGSAAATEPAAGFRLWLAERPGPVGVTPETQAAHLATGLALARARRPHIERLIRENPEQAIAEALTFAEWDALPPEVQALVEKPFSIVADYDFYPVCTPPGGTPHPDTPEYIAALNTGDGSSLETFVYGGRRDSMSKKKLPAQGISLGNLAAMRDGALQVLATAEVPVARKLFDTTLADSGLSFATGESVGTQPVYAVSGGRLLVFSSLDEVASANERLAQADAKPGLVAASSYLLPFGEGEIDWDNLESFADEQASTWTETKKKVFLIRINFPFALAEPVTQAAASTVMNGAVSDSIREQSYNKTWIEATVSANLYTLPQTAAYYVNGGSNGLNDQLIRDARNTFRNQKSGADAAINIGPVSNNTNGDEFGVGDYDIVGVTFTGIGMTSGTVLYAGLAGGNRIWMQNNNSSGVFIHEFGHNYGLGHASSWDVTSNNPVDPAGTSTEYGDIFDIMGDGPDPEGHFHAQAKQKLDWLTASQWQDATALGSNTYRIYRIDDTNTTAANSRGVRITKVTSPAEYYWLSYRPAFENNVTQKLGVYLNWQRSGQTRCWLLDTTPNSTDGKIDSSITLGRTYSDSTDHVHITTLATGGTGADQWVEVRVNLGLFPGNTAPAADPIVGPATVPARTSATFSGSGSDANGDTLAYHWNTNDGLVNDNTTGISHNWVVGGTYTIDLTVSDMKGGTDTENKTVTVTDPIDTWTLQTSGITGSLPASIWGKGRFVVAETFGSILTSWDGVTWTNVGEPPDFDRDPRLAHGNGMFVVVGKKNGVSAAQICYSSDARTWNVATFPAGVPVPSTVMFANNRFLAAAAGGHVLSSTDGINWSLTTVSGTPDFRYLAWDGSVWLAMAFNSGNNRAETVWTSTDGLTWTQHADLGFSVYSVSARAGVFYATGWYGGVSYSTDHGLTWKTAETPGATRWSTGQIAVADDGTLLVGGTAMDEGSPGNRPKAWLVSTNGTQWFRSSAGVGYAYDTRSLTFGFGRFLATGDGGAIRTSGPFHPNNTAPAASFTLAPTTAPARENRLFASVATDADDDTLTYAWDFGLPGLITDGANVVKSFDFGGTYTATCRVSDGKGGLTTLTRDVSVADPARTWTQRTSGTDKNLNAIASDGNLAVAVGGNGGVIRTSTDGVIWATRTVSNSGNITFRGAAWDGSQFVAVGQDYNFTDPAGWQGVIYTSTDGTSWTRRFGGGTDRSNELQAVAAGGGRLVAVGNNGTILQSTDGTNWTPVTVSGLASSILKGVACGGGTWLISGHHTESSGTGKVYTSTDRTQWMDQTAGAGFDASWQDMRKTAYLNNRFVGSGWYSKLRVSTDLGATFSTTRTDSEETPGLAYGDNIYFAAGVNRSASSADIDLLSLDGTNWTRSAAPTADDRNGAVFFKHTFITVGAGGTLWQSADTTPDPATNHAPTFAGYATATPYETTATISLATILTSAGDVDGDALIATATGASAQGGGSQLQAASIRYTPPPGFSGTDTFSVTITDEHGLSVSGILTVVVEANTGGAVTTPPVLTLLPDGGGALIEFHGIPNQPYLIQRSINLSAWIDLATPTASPIGVVSFIDLSPPAGKAFYRIRLP